jgi:hypothetical protein
MLCEGHSVRRCYSTVCSVAAPLMAATVTVVNSADGMVPEVTKSADVCSSGGAHSGVRT